MIDIVNFSQCDYEFSLKKKINKIIHNCKIIITKNYACDKCDDRGCWANTISLVTISDDLVLFCGQNSSKLVSGGK